MIIFCTTVKINSMRYEKNTVIGILAHVDAGKTTLSEAMLYLSGKIKTLGRVDHRDSYLDNHFLERERGITIFSKQARLELPGSAVTLLDTPGHADFSAEAERTLQERLADRIGKNNAVRVVTSDNLIRLSALRSGVLRCSSAEFKAELEQTLKTIDDILRRSSEGAHMTRLKDGKQ